MAIVKIEKNKVVLIDKDFELSKTGRCALVDVKFHFPASFIKTAKDGKSKFITFDLSEIQNYMFDSTKKDPIAQQMEDEGIDIEEDICETDEDENDENGN
ncbi:MAG: hypothetical protein LBC44_03105 [Mycoplasmataceae bacterium]|jgi:hypothetical protein|nr:hypothetical protein [Mycoplasmataceae bacterium]